MALTGAAKAAAKSVVQRSVLAGPVYVGLRRAALARSATEVADAREQLGCISPKPAHIRAEAAPMGAPSLDVSVVVPVYNVAPFVGACLGSVLAQELPNGNSLEVIAVDDGSTDGCAAILAAYARRDARLRVITQANAGLSAARNAGLDASRGRFIAFVDSDDELAPGHLAALLAAAREGGADVVSALWTRVEEDGTPRGTVEARRTNMAPWARLYRREVWRDLRFPVGCWYEDLITPCCVQPRSTESFIDDAGYRYRTRPGSIVAETSSNPKALDTYWALEELLGWRSRLGITYRQPDLDHLLGVMGPTLMGRLAARSVDELRAVFSLCCDLLASLVELADVRTSRVGGWRDVELALRTRRFELWCLACAATAAESKDVKISVAWSYFVQSMGRARGGGR